MNPLADTPLETRADAQQAMRDVFAPLKPHFSAGRARVAPSSFEQNSGRTAGELEGFARPLWGLVPLVAGGGTFGWGDEYARGLANGTDPDHPEYWGPIRDTDQKAVEASVIGYGLAVAPELLWEPLDGAARDRVVAWLDGVNDVPLVDNNWRWFRVLVNCGLRAVDAAWDRDRVADDIAFLDTCYVGDGWYTDGPEGPGDWYVAWAMHLYGLLVAEAMGEADAVGDPERFRERARQFAPDHAAWFGDDGSALPYGRSLSYRFAQAGFWGGLAVADVEALPWGAIRGLWARTMRWWADQPIGTGTGVLTVGYRYESLRVAEGYYSPGSPYWATKAFLPLMLDADHPFWTADEAPHPGVDAPVDLPAAKMVVDRSEGRPIAYPAGRPDDRWNGRYTRHAYSTDFGFSVPSGASLDRVGVDGALCLAADGEHWRARESVDETAVDNGVIRSRWQPWGDVCVATTVVPAGPWHVRAHRVDTDRTLHAAEGGFPLQQADDPDEGTAVAEPGRVAITTPAGVSRVRAVGPEQDRSGRAVADFPSSNVVHPCSTTPVLASEHEPGTHHLVSLVGAVTTGDLPAAPVVDIVDGELQVVAGERSRTVPLAF
jgi:hypothetical protein